MKKRDRRQACPTLMLRGLVRIFVVLMALLVVRAAMKAIFKFFEDNLGPSSADPQPKQAAGVHTGGELKKDPVCGTFVSEATAVTKTVNGEVLHFCSAACRDKYRAA